ncbi:MAG TPA: Calx-beta domain-containing protein [Verrucomicrobiae bacterium]|nr:Calx-beta domain-containing protein [Verrucomicrobiae bacterium]
MNDSIVRGVLRAGFVCLLGPVLSSPAIGAIVAWSAAASRAVVLADGATGVPSGDLVRLGYFDISDGQVAANAADVTFLDSHFFQFAVASIGSGTGVDGTFIVNSNNSGTNFPGQQIHIWVLNATTLGAATQQGVFDAPANSAWTFPPQQPVAGSTTIDIADTNVTAVVGSLGGSVIISTNLPFASSAVLAAIPPTSDVQQYAVLKGQEFVQTSTNSPAISTNSPFEFFSFVDASSSGSVMSATIQDPNALVHTLSSNLSALRFQFSDSFTNKVTLDAAYSNATYRFSIVTPAGSQMPTVTLPADNYPNAPHITNWDAAQLIDPTRSFTVTWDPFAGGTTNDVIQLSIADSGGTNVFATPSDYLDPARLTGGSSSALIPAQTLVTGQTYRAELMFVKVTSLDTNTVPGEAGVGGFFSATAFDMAAASSTLAFSAATYSVNQTDGVAIITVGRVGDTNGTATVDFATADGSAKAPADYTATTGTVTFVAGQTNATFTVAVVNTEVYGVTTVNLTLSNPSGAALGSRSTAVLQIIGTSASPGAARIDFLQSELDGVLECTANVTLTLISPDRPGAAAEISDCVAAAQQLLDDAQAQATIDALGTKGAKKLQKRFAALLKRLIATQTVLDDSTKSDAKALQSLTKVSVFGAKTQRVFLKFKKEAPFVVLEELKLKNGIHFSNQRVCYRIHVMDLANGAICGPGTITVTNLYVSGDLIIVQEGIIVKSDTDFCVVTGPAEGGAVITVTACGGTSSLPLVSRVPTP